MMKTVFVLLLAFGFSKSDKLDRTYLPPPGSQFSGGSVYDLKTPLDLPKQYFTTGAPQTLVPQGQTEIVKEYSDRVNAPYTFSNNVPSSTEIPQRDYSVPTTTTSYAFSQTTTYSPIEDTGYSRNNLLPEGQNNEYYQQNNQGQDFRQLNPVLPGFNQPINNQQYVSTEKYVQKVNLDTDRKKPNQNHNAFIPSLNNYNQQNQYENHVINEQKTLKLPVQEQLSTSYGQTFDGLPGKSPQFNQNMQFSTSAPDLPYPSSHTLNPEIPTGKLTYEKSQLDQLGNNYTNLIPDNTQSYYKSARVRLPSTKMPFTVTTPNRVPETFSQISSIYGNAPNYPNHPDSTDPFKPSDNNAAAPITTQNYDTYTGSSKLSTPTSTPFNNIDFTTNMPYKFSDISMSKIPVLSVNANLSNPSIRAERPQAEGDRNAIILNYENKLSPEGFSYSFDTSNGIHADESGTTINGVKAQGAYSYIGDDGKVYSVIYTADENGFLPRGDHLPTPPPIPEAIKRVIEQAKKNKEAGIIQDGSYDDNKYGYKKYQGPIEFYRPKQTKNSERNGTAYFNRNNHSLRPSAIYNSEANKEDTMDYIEEDVNAFDDIKTGGKYSAVPNTQHAEMDQIIKEKQFNVINDDQKATIGINRQSGSPNRNREKTNIQNTGSLDNIYTVTKNRNQQTTPSVRVYSGQTVKEINEQRPSTPDMGKVGYNAQANGKIPSRKQILEDRVSNIPLYNYGTAQNTFQIGDEVTVSKENKQQSYNPNIESILNTEPLKNIGQNKGYEYTVPMKTFGLIQSTQSSYSNVPENESNVNIGQKVTAKPFITPIIDSVEDSEEYNNGNNSNNAKFVQHTPFRNTISNIITPSQSPQQSYTEGTKLNFEVTENSQNEYLPSDNEHNKYNFQSTTTPTSEQTFNSVSLPSSTPEYVTTYRPVMISTPFNAQTLPTRTSSSPIQQSRADYEKRYPTTTYRPHYVIKDTQVSNVHVPMPEIQGQPAGQIDEKFFVQKDNQRYTQSQKRPTPGLESTERIQSNQVFNSKVPATQILNRPSKITGQNNPEFENHGVTVGPINGIPEAVDHIQQTQAYQNIGSTYPVGPATITEDKIGRPLISQGELNQGYKNQLPDYTVSNDQATTNKYQGSPTTYNYQSGQEIKGEDFSGPKQEQKFDPKTGYYYK